MVKRLHLFVSAAIACTVSLAQAAPITYNVNFTQTIGASTQSATFVFDQSTQVFSSFIFTLQGNAFDFTGAANNGDLDGFCGPELSSLGFAVLSGATRCQSNQVWNFTSTNNFFLANFFASAFAFQNDTSQMDSSIFIRQFGAVSVPANLTNVNFGGRFTISAVGAAVPEPESILLIGIGLLAAGCVSGGARRFAA